MVAERKQRRRRNRWLFGLFLAAVGLIALPALWMGTSGSTGRDDEDTSMRKLAAGLTSGRYQVLERTLHYISSGKPGRPLVIFVHGSPGDWTAFEWYLLNTDLLRSVRMISVDRPGFGSSGFGQYVGSLRQQSAMLYPLLEQSGPEGVILVGHSLGGSVIARLAMDFPERVAGLVMVAPSIDPQLEKIRWYNRLASLSAIRLLLPQALDSSNQEILPLRSELERMLPLWKRIRVPCVVIQGLRDKLVAPGNADFAERVLTEPPARVERISGAGHFILWERPQLIKNALQDLATEVWGQNLRGSHDEPQQG